MQFPTRQLLILVTCLGIWVGMLVHGHYFVGNGGVICNAVTVACSCWFLFHMLNRWQKIAWAERLRYATAVLILLTTAFTLERVALSYGLGLEREVHRLNETVQRLSPYSSVEFSLDKRGYVRADGLVASQRDLDKLRAMVEHYSKCGQTYWQVDIKK